MNRYIYIYINPKTQETGAAGAVGFLQSIADTLGGKGQGKSIFGQPFWLISSLLASPAGAYKCVYAYIHICRCIYICIIIMKETTTGPAGAAGAGGFLQSLAETLGGTGQGKSMFGLPFGLKTLLGFSDPSEEQRAALAGWRRSVMIPDCLNSNPRPWTLNPGPWTLNPEP